MKIIQGDCVEVMRGMEDESVDAVVCDPPYMLRFMGREWDDGGTPAQQQEAHLTWTREAYRVLKPGGHIVAFGGTRTYHRLACAIEDAGFEIRDSLHWVYGSGFPKSHDVSKAIDRTSPRRGMFADFAEHFKARREASGLSQKAIAVHFPSRTGGLTGCVWNWENGANVPTLAQWETLAPLLDLSDEWLPLIERIEAEREVVGHVKGCGSNSGSGCLNWNSAGDEVDRTWYDATAPATPEAQQWDGWGTALKPSHEPIVLARKPLIGTVAENVLTHGTGALNVDGCRVGTGARTYKGSGVSAQRYSDSRAGLTDGRGSDLEYTASGRWPPNFVMTHHPDCRQVGVKNVRGGMAHEPNGKPMERSIYGKTGTLGRKEGYAPDGTETVPDMDCHPDCPVKALGEMSGELSSGGPARHPDRYSRPETNQWLIERTGTAGPINGYADHGTASRFFPCFKYNAKSSTAERGLGLPDGERNTHPTVKPVDLMRWLVRLVTPPGGTVLDPFLGSGTTALACALEGVECVGIERDEGYVETARKRVAWAEEHVRKYGRPPIDMGTVEAAAREKDEDPKQVSLFGED